MIELFSDIPIEVKQKNQLIIDYMFQNFQLYQVLNFINNYILFTSDNEEKDFIRFYVNLKMEQLNNENNND